MAKIFQGLVLFAFALVSALAANSDVCTNASSYTGSVNSGLGSNCDTDISSFMGLYASSVSACSTAVLSGHNYTEGGLTQVLSGACCSDGLGVCDNMWDIVCQNTSAWNPNSQSGISGCTTGSTGCSSDGVWLCNSLAGVFDSGFTMPITDCSSAAYGVGTSDAYSTEAEATQYLGNNCCTDHVSTCGPTTTTTTTIAGLGDAVASSATRQRVLITVVAVVAMFSALF
jgi:hypothetical protein